MQHASDPTVPGSRPETAADPAEFWEQRYAGADQVWSGRVNAALADVAAGLKPGTALDLGCGEGADVVWLATQGWEATGLDISATALERAASAAAAAGVSDRTRFVRADVSALPTPGTFDLVTASFLHSPVALARTEVLRHAAALVAPGGHLLITSHAAPPPWAGDDAHEHHLLTPDEALHDLALDPSAWEILVAEIRQRLATSPDGEPATLQDAVVLAHRRVSVQGSTA